MTVVNYLRHKKDSFSIFVPGPHRTYAHDKREAARCGMSNNILLIATNYVLLPRDVVFLTGDAKSDSRRYMENIFFCTCFCQRGWDKNTHTDMFKLNLVYTNTNGAHRLKYQTHNLVQFALIRLLACLSTQKHFRRIVLCLKLRLV